MFCEVSDLFMEISLDCFDRIADRVLRLNRLGMKGMNQFICQSVLSGFEVG